MKFFLTLLFIMISWNSYANEIYPAGCKPIVVNEESVKLESAEPALVMIHNLATTDLWITHPVTDPSASAGWSSRLQAGNWSALAMNDKRFELSCIESRPGHEQQLSCAGVLAVCAWEKVSMPDNAKHGTAWAGEDMGLVALTAYVHRMGFVMNKASGKE